MTEVVETKKEETVELTNMQKAQAEIEAVCKKYGVFLLVEPQFKIKLMEAPKPRAAEVKSEEVKEEVKS